jgi:hypothetical protein
VGPHAELRRRLGDELEARVAELKRRRREAGQVVAELVVPELPALGSSDRTMLAILGSSQTITTTWR